MDMTQNKCCRHGANLRRRRRRRRKILRSIIFSCSIIAVAVFVAVGSSMIRSGDGRTNKYDVGIDPDFKRFEFSSDLKLNEEIIEQIKKLVRPGIISYLKYRLFNIY